MAIFQPLLRKKPIPPDTAASRNLEESQADLVSPIVTQNFSGNTLSKSLGVWDLTGFGVAAILGAGVFTTIGNAAYTGGPAVILLFIFTAIACGFCALCYAEFAAMLPVSGSAYSYAYVVFGELIAWIIGWNLILEYAISNIAVSLSWSQYFVDCLRSYGFQPPAYLISNYFESYSSFLLVKDNPLTTFSPLIQQGFLAWTQAPQIFDLRIIFDLPNIFITVVITWIVLIGIRESRSISNVLVLLKVGIIFLVIAAGAAYIRPENWIPFSPHGFSGVLKGVSSIFFAYIGFDAISTTAEECKNPQRDLPRAMIYSLLICTVLYTIIALVLTGITSSNNLKVADPLAFVFGPQGANIRWVQEIVQIGAVAALSSVLLIYQIGQPRIWMTMSRDGLLPKIFSVIHPRYHTPWFSTYLTALVVIIPSFFWGLTEVTDLASIGTLSSFVIVSAGILIKNPYGRPNGRFVTPYFNSRVYLFWIWFIVIACGLWIQPEFLRILLKQDSPLSQQIASQVFIFFAFGLSLLSIWKAWSLIPTLGVVCCCFLLSEISLDIWSRFGVWLALGLFIYFLYGFWNSHLRNQTPIRKPSSVKI